MIKMTDSMKRIVSRINGSTVEELVSLSKTCGKSFTKMELSEEDLKVLKGMDESDSFYALVFLEGVGVKTEDPKVRLALTEFCCVFDSAHGTNFTSVFCGNVVKIKLGGN